MESSFFFAQWQNLTLRQESPLPEIHIALVGKYTRLQDSYLSVSKAIQHAALYCKRKARLHYIQADLLEETARDIDPVKFHDSWQTMCSSQALIVPGGFGQRGTEGMITAINWARTHDMPFLGVCLGMQLAAVEFARNKLGLADANSSELQPESSNHIIIEMPEFNPVTKGGTMRLGKRRTIFTNKEDSVLWKLYGKPDVIDERHRHRYEINPEYVTKLESEGMQFVGCDIDTHQRMEIMELKGHYYFVGCQYHPEYLTRPLKPSPPYLGLILAATHKLSSYFAQGNRTHSPSNSLQSSDFISWPLEF
ncbi:CTP synthase 1-B-like [Oopsacas minuta]|uniref:CTP synthase (glutamine hydrolyzing) n=1 Tax=Oopsacas minuta TaxID=111878 RepID=A0AAV7K3H4_9METZ|nr:CTP synthase 1-B-like [Oopsacas minuta]